MQWIHKWTAAFDYEDLDRVIADMQACNAFEKSPVMHKLLLPVRVETTASSTRGSRCL